MIINNNSSLGQNMSHRGAGIVPKVLPEGWGGERRSATAPPILIYDFFKIALYALANGAGV